MSTLDQLLDRGVALKRLGDLEGAKDCYIKALDIDPFNMMTYISLGKTAHLLKAQDLAVRCYLASTHLQLAPIEKSINENRLPMHLKVQYDIFPQDILKQLPRKSAFVIFIDPNTPRHIAHSIIDLSPKTLNENPHLKAYCEVYHAHILGNGTHDETLKKWGLTSSNQIETDEQIYIPFGRNFLVQELQWDNLSRNDVLNIYF
jgi:tetratricopeptide (TPR) repeat protein